MAEYTENDVWLPLVREEIDAPIMKVVGEFVKSLPDIPVHVHRLLEIVSDTDSDSIEVANAASADPGLVSKILRAVNSSYYGLSNSTDNIHFAIVLLGFNEVRKIALQASLTGMFTEGRTKEGYDIRGLWEHSYLVSVCAETLARERNSKSAGELLTFGLLHDIGKFALLKLAIAMKNKGVAPYRSTAGMESAPAIEKEDALFKVNHPVVGSMLAERLVLSKRISAIIEYHHHPSYRPIETVPEEYILDVATIGVSDAIVNHITGHYGMPEPLPEYFEVIGLKAPVDACLNDDLREKLDDARKFISVVR